MAININLSKLKKISPKVQTLIVAIPVVAMVALFVFLVYLPKSKEIKNLSARITTLNKEISVSEAKVRKLDVLIEENKVLKAKLEKLKEQLPEEKEVSVLLKQISDSGLQAGLEMLLWKPEARKTSPDNLYVEIPVKVEVLTGYHNLGIFFSNISRLPRLVNMSDLNLRIKDKGGKGGSEGLITAAFTARTFASVSSEEAVQTQETEKDKKDTKEKKETK